MGLKLINISKSYGLGIGKPRKKILDNVNMEIQDGEMVAIVGRRGSGKTALMNIMTGLTRPDSGHYMIDGKVVGLGRMFKMASFRAKDCGIITRDPLLVSDMTLFENITMPLNHRFMTKKRKLKRAREVLRGLGLKGKGRFYPTEFSVLDRQKVCAGRAMIAEPKYIFADEPTGCLSAADRERFMDFLEVLNSAGYTIIVFTYSKRVAAHCQRMIPVAGEAVPEPSESEKDDFADQADSVSDETQIVSSGADEADGVEDSPEVYEILDEAEKPRRRRDEDLSADDEEERYARGEEAGESDDIPLPDPEELPERPRRRSSRKRQ
ncbi:MAG: ATP-binding cassette domain-containing protein [Lachnospiraceae bacterium]|nr:ATP-binding cassette domain-containing protein [Lachnospiraceae bacterium]